MMTSNPILVTVPAPNDVVVAWPDTPQQLFLLLPDAGQNPHDILAMAQRLAGTFTQGAVAIVAPPHSCDEGGEGFQWFSQRGEDDSNRVQRLQAAQPEFLATVQAWQQRTGLPAERTALLAFGQSGMLALEAVAQSHQVAARVFAIGARYAQLPPAMHQHTTLHWLHGKEDEVVPYHAATEAGYHLRSLDADFTVDVFAETGRALTSEMQDRVLHLLQNHVPLRIWREAMTQAAQQADGNDTVH